MITAAIISEPTVDQAIPQVQRLSDIRHQMRVGEIESEASKMQAVRVLSEIVGCGALTTFRTELGSINLLVSASEVFLHPRLLGLEPLLVWKRVPAPVAQRTQRHASGIILRECLQARGIDRAGEMSVAHRE